MDGLNRTNDLEVVGSGQAATTAETPKPTFKVNPTIMTAVANIAVIGGLNRATRSTGSAAGGAAFLARGGDVVGNTGERFFFD